MLTQYLKKQHLCHIERMRDISRARFEIPRRYALSG